MYTLNMTATDRLVEMTGDDKGGYGTHWLISPACPDDMYTVMVYKAVLNAEGVPMVDLEGECGFIEIPTKDATDQLVQQLVQLAKEGQLRDEYKRLVEWMPKWHVSMKE